MIRKPYPSARFSLRKQIFMALIFVVDQNERFLATFHVVRVNEVVEIAGQTAFLPLRPEGFHALGFFNSDNTVFASFPCIARRFPIVSLLADCTNCDLFFPLTGRELFS